MCLLVGVIIGEDASQNKGQKTQPTLQSILGEEFRFRLNVGRWPAEPPITRVGP